VREKPGHELNLNESMMDSDGMLVAILTALATNSTVQRLNIARTDIADEKVGVALSHLLCDETSFDNTRMSNHTLNTIRWKDKPLDQDLGHGIASYLKMNRN
jgi:hypothetical protein